MEAGALEVDPEPLRGPDAVIAVMDGLLDVEDDAGRALAAPEAEVEDLGQASWGRAGQGRVLRPGSLLHRRVHLRRARGLGKSGQVLAAGGGDVLAVAAGAGDLEHAPERLLLEAAARVVRHQPA